MDLSCGSVYFEKRKVAILAKKLERWKQYMFTVSVWWSVCLRISKQKIDLFICMTTNTGL